MIKFIAVYLILHFSIAEARFWDSPDGRSCMMNDLQPLSTALDLWPPNVLLYRDSVAELTIHKTHWSDPKVERISISAMAKEDEDGGMYRVGIEAENGGKHHNLIFCFEATSPGKATCVLKLTPKGVFIKRWGQWAEL